MLPRLCRPRFIFDPSMPPRLHRSEWWLLGLGVTLWVLLPFYQLSGLTGDWFDLGWPWKSGGIKIGYVRDFNSLGVHPYLSATLGLNLLTWGAVVLSLRLLLLALKDHRWPVMVARIVIIGVLVSALIVAAPGFVRMAERFFA